MTTQVSNILSIDRKDYKRVDYKEAFRLATLGGSQGLIGGMLEFETAIRDNGSISDDQT